MKTTFNTLCLLLVLLAAVSSVRGEEEKTQRDFCFDFYRNLASSQPDRNLVFSPYSLQSALGMVGMAAAGPTEAEIAAVLGKTDTWQDYAAGLNLPSKKDAADSPVKLANALWVQQGTAVLPEFDQQLTAHFHAGIGRVDFINAPERGCEFINRWFSEKTNGKIPTLFEKFDRDARCVLGCAVYFSAEWKSPFSEHDTNDGIFVLADNSEKNTKFMSQKRRFQYIENEEVTILELPYKNEGYSMLLMLPPTTADLAKLETGLSVEKLTAWRAAMQPEMTEVMLPKFETTHDIPLNRVLEELGMPLAFSREANLSGINGKQDLYLSDAVQKIYIRVDETGTEAAAATAVVGAIKAMFPDVKTFHANRPFLYAICRDNGEGKPLTMIFVGRFACPEGETAPAEEPAETPADQPQEDSPGEPLPDPSLAGEGGAFT